MEPGSRSGRGFHCAELDSDQAPAPRVVVIILFLSALTGQTELDAEGRLSGSSNPSEGDDD